MNKREYTPLIELQPASKDFQVNEYKLYRRRWYILSVFTAIAFLVNLAFNTWTPILEPCKVIFGWENWQIILIASWSAICVLVGSGPSVWFLNKRGLRAAVILCVFQLTIGKVFQMIPSSDPLIRTILLNIGQCIAMLSTPVGLGAPPLISGTWFPPKERTTATAISTLVGTFGMAFGFLVGPNMVQTKTLPSEIHNHTVSNQTIYDFETITANLSQYMGLQLAMSALVLACVLVYFPDEPPLPPCATSSSRPHEHKKEFKMMISDYRYLYLAFLCAINNGVYFPWLGLLALAVGTFGIGESLASWIGTFSVVAGIFSGIIIARLVDIIDIRRHTKRVLMFLLFGLSISQLLFALTCSRIIPFSKPLLFSSVIFGGFFYNATTPLFFEMAVETVYPVAEGMTIIFLLVTANVISLVFAVVFMFPSMNVAWMNWALVFVSGLSVPGLMGYRSKLKRLELECL